MINHTFDISMSKHETYLLAYVSLHMTSNCGRSNYLQQNNTNSCIHHFSHLTCLLHSIYSSKRKEKKMWNLAFNIFVLSSFQSYIPYYFSLYDIETNSGSRYPGVPVATVKTCVAPSVGIHLERPTLAIFAWKLPVNNMFVVFTSVWTTGGLQPWCRYSNPAFESPCFCLFLAK